MEELEKLIKATLSVSNIEQAELFEGIDKKSIRFRKMLCYTAREKFPHLINPLAKEMGVDISSVYDNARAAEGIMHSMDDTFSEEMRLIWRLLNERENDTLRTKAIEKEKKQQEMTQRLFGFKYSPSDELKMARVIKASIRHMDKLSEIGVQPHIAGFPISRQSKK